MNKKVQARIDRLGFKKYELLIGYPKVYNYMIVVCYLVMMVYMYFATGRYEAIFAIFLVFVLMFVFQFFYQYDDVLVYKGGKFYRVSKRPLVKDAVVDCEFKRSLFGKYYVVGPNIGKFNVLSVNESQILKRIKKEIEDVKR